jgi:hypothetical protein
MNKFTHLDKHSLTICPTNFSGSSVQHKSGKTMITTKPFPNLDAIDFPEIDPGEVTHQLDRDANTL